MKSKILVVDDEMRNVRILRELLEDNYDLECCYSGEECLEALKQSKPALVLLDIMMPGLDGYEVCRRIGQMPDLKGTNVILVSGRAMIENRLEGYEAGAQDFIAKPFNHDELAAKVKTHVDLYVAQSRLEEINEDLDREICVRTNNWIRNEKMAFVGMHAAELVHNLNGPLTVMMACADILRIEGGAGNSYINSMSDAADNMREIICSIIDTTRSSSANLPRSIDVNEMIRTEVELSKLSALLGSTISVRLELEEVLNLQLAPIHFSQIIGNLIKNAADAMYESVTPILTITTRSSADGVLISVKDCGCGIPADALEQVFESMYTTKARTPDSGAPSGTGLGLASVKRMVESYDGSILVESEAGVGSTFTLRFPHPL